MLCDAASTPGATSKQIAMRYESPHCGFNESGFDVGAFESGEKFETNGVGGYGGIGQYLILTNSRGETDLEDTLKSLKACANGRLASRPQGACG